MKSNPRTATFLFTDLENSTPLWESYPKLLPELSARHDDLIRTSIESSRGRVVKTMGDGFHAVFETATDGVLAALLSQQRILEEPWPAETGPLRVRMGLHTGESEQRDDDFYGSEVNRAARVMGLAHGGQILISSATAALIRNALPQQVALLNLGEHRLKGLSTVESIFQLFHPALPSEFPPLKSLSVLKHNLPVQLSTFVGREKEVADAKALLKEARLLTMLGPGGTGKTRLMMEAAEELVGDFTDGVWLIELAPLADPSLISERIAAVFGVQEQPGRSMREAITAYLRQKDLLLLLDNVEHLVRECAALAEHLLSRCPSLKILVTGREALFIGGEITLQIPSLSLPGNLGDSSFNEIESSEGVQLFLARGQDIHPEMELTPKNAPEIAEIVSQLDGIPLAIELAAARLRMLTVEQVAERLNDRFRLLTGGRRTALPRQQTLQAMIDWSWNLLDEKERLLFQRLSVFSGGWSLEAAQSVANDNLLDEYDVIDLLEQLVNKSLVTFSYPVSGEARYRMLESIHQYGRDRLFEAGEAATLRDRHADYFAAFTDEAGPQLAKYTMLVWTDRITQELDNLRAVLAWTLEDRPEAALRIGANLLYREAYSLSPREARSWLEPAVERTRGHLNDEETKVRKVDFIRALLGLGLANGIQGRIPAAFALAEESIQLARGFGEYRYVAYATALKYFQHPFNMNPDEMQELEEAVDICREKRLDEELGLLLIVYGTALDDQGKPELALPILQEAVEVTRRTNTRLDAGVFGVLARLARSLGNVEEAKRNIKSVLEDYEALNHRRGIIMGQSALAHILRSEGDLDESEEYYRQSIIGWQELGHRPAVAHQIECLAYIAIARGELEHGAMLLGSAANARVEMNSLSEDPQEIQELSVAVDHLMESMGSDRTTAIMAQGNGIDLDKAVILALKNNP